MVCMLNGTCNFVIKIQKGMYPTWKQICMMYSWVRKLKLHFSLRVAALFHHLTGSDKMAKSGDIRVLHQSSDFLVVDKCFDVLINSDDPGVVITVEHQIRKILPHYANDKLAHGFHFVHRLDYSTSGLLCLAFHKKAANLGSTAFSTRKTRKYYLALLRGHVSHELIDISLPIGADSRPNHTHKMCSSDKQFCQYPKAAFTRLLVLQKGFYDGYPVTKVMLKPVTGRRHQLRIHCSLLGHTIVGDFTYSNGKDVLPYRMFLHSYRLILPTAIETIDVCAGDPFLSNDHVNSKWLPVVTVNATGPETYEKLDTQFPNVSVDHLDCKA